MEFFPLIFEIPCSINLYPLKLKIFVEYCIVCTTKLSNNFMDSIFTFLNEIFSRISFIFGQNSFYITSKFPLCLKMCFFLYFSFFFGALNSNLETIFQVQYLSHRRYPHYHQRFSHGLYFL